ncbi:MAG: TatD family hydrolase [Candidatus Diapherotrites archaeon]
MFVDSHCHLDWFGEEAGKVLARAGEKDVRAVVSCATNPESIAKNLALAQKFSRGKCGVFVCLGLHPSDLLRMKKAEIEAGIESVRKNCGARGVVGAGEVGLDYKHATAPAQKKKQQKVFAEFIQIAKEKNLPLVVHSRFAERETMELLRKHRAERVVMHWFTNSVQSVKTAEDLGFFYTAGPAILHYADAAKVAAKMRLENLMLETDAPVEFAGKRAEPSWIPRLAEKAAELHGTKAAEIEKTTTKNAKAFFGFA